MTEDRTNCIDCLQQKVDELTAILCKDDECPPKFVVSEEVHCGKILLTASHLGYVHTDVLFPNGDYGNVSISYLMEQLYNSICKKRRVNNVMTEDYTNCIDCLQKKVDELTVNLYKGDECPPKYIVSEEIHRRKILLTISHLGYVHTGVLFPNTDFEDVSIAYIMEQLYNSTM